MQQQHPQNDLVVVQHADSLLEVNDQQNRSRKHLISFDFIKDAKETTTIDQSEIPTNRRMTIDQQHKNQKIKKTQDFYPATNVSEPHSLETLDVINPQLQQDTKFQQSMTEVRYPQKIINDDVKLVNQTQASIISSNTLQENRYGIDFKENEQKELFESYNSKSQKNEQSSLQNKHEARPGRSSLQNVSLQNQHASVLKQSRRVQPSLPQKNHSDVLPNLIGSKPYPGIVVPIRQTQAYPTLQAQKHVNRNQTQKPSSKQSYKQDKAAYGNYSISGPELVPNVKQQVVPGYEKKSRASIQVGSRTTAVSTNQEVLDKKSFNDEKRKDKQEGVSKEISIEVQKEPLSSQPSSLYKPETNAVITEDSRSRSADQQSSKGLYQQVYDGALKSHQNLAVSRSKDKYQMPTKSQNQNNSKSAYGPVKRQAKERIYVGNYLEANSSLANTGQLIQSQSSMQPMKNLIQKSGQKRQNATASNIDVTTEVYLQFQKATSQLQNNSNYVAQLIQKNPAQQTLNKSQKSKRPLIEKKPYPTSTEWVSSPSNKDMFPFGTQQLQESEVQKTQVTTSKDANVRHAMSGGFVPESLMIQKDVITSNIRNKSMNFPTYYKGGSSATNDRRQVTGLKEAAIQMIENRTTKTTIQNRVSNVSPMTNTKRQAAFQNQSSNLEAQTSRSKKKSGKKKDTVQESSLLAKNGNQALNRANLDSEKRTKGMLENYYRQSQVVKINVKDEIKNKQEVDDYKDFIKKDDMPFELAKQTSQNQPTTSPKFFVKTKDSVLEMKEIRDLKDRRRSHTQKSDRIISSRKTNQPSSPHWNQSACQKQESYPSSAIQTHLKSCSINPNINLTNMDLEYSQNQGLAMINSTDTIKRISNQQLADQNAKTEAVPSPKSKLDEGISRHQLPQKQTLPATPKQGEHSIENFKTFASHQVQSPVPLKKDKSKARENKDLKQVKPQLEITAQSKHDLISGMTYSPVRRSQPQAKSGNTTTQEKSLLNNAGAVFAALTPAPHKKFQNLHQVIQEQIIMRRAPELLHTNVPSHYYLKQGETQRARQFKYQVLNGNNGTLVKRIMQETRSNLWIELPNSQQNHYHFRWAPTSRSINFDRLSHNFVQMVNHVEGHVEITTKNELFKNVKQFFDERNLNAFHAMPITFCLKINPEKNDNSIKKQLNPFKQVFNLLEEFKSFFEVDQTQLVAPPPKSPQSLKNELKNLQSNEEKNGDEYTPKKEKKKKNKNAFQQSPQRRFMEKMLDDQDITKMPSLREAQQILHEKPCQILISRKGRELDYINGETHIKTKVGGSLVKKFTSKSSGLVMPLNHFAGKNVWILKPTSFNRGKGIHVISDLKKLKKLIKDYSGGRETSLIVPVPSQVVAVRNQSVAPITSLTSYKVPWNYNPLPIKLAIQANSIPIQHKQQIVQQTKTYAGLAIIQQNEKALTIGPSQKYKQAHLLVNKNHKSNLSQTQINNQLLVKGAPLAIKSQNFNQGQLKSKIQEGEKKNKVQQETDTASARSDIVDDYIDEKDKFENINLVETFKGTHTSKQETDNKHEEEARYDLERETFDQNPNDQATDNTQGDEFGNENEKSIAQNLKGNKSEIIQNETENNEQKQSLSPFLHSQKRDIQSNPIESEPVPRRDNANLNYPEPREGRGEAKNGIKTTTFIIQKYIEQPALINGRKFDIRVWVLLDQNHDVYFFEEGYLRCSGYEYTMSNDNLDDDFIHLTNNAIQKNCPNYGAHEDGNQLSFQDLKKWLKSMGNKPQEFDNFILPKMKYQAAVSLYSARKKFNPSKRKHCFELFGFDYILDKDLNVFLIECNTNPCIEESSKILKRLLPRMLDDMFKLTIDQIFQSSKQDQASFMGQNKSPIKNPKTLVDFTNAAPDQKASIYHVPGYKDTHNMWERIATIRGSNSSQNPIFVDNPKHLYQVSQSERMIQLVNQYEMRVAKTELVDKLIRRDMAVNATAQLAFANF